MKRKNGFTLIELLAVIVILGILLSITTVAVNKIRKKQEAENRRNVFIQVLTGARNYLTDHPEKLDFTKNTEKTFYGICVDELIRLGYVDIDDRYLDLVKVDGWISSVCNSNYRNLEANLCKENNESNLKYSLAFYDKTRTNVSYLKNKAPVLYNDCGCENQEGNVKSTKICIGPKKTGRNGKSTDFTSGEYILDQDLLPITDWSEKSIY